MLVYGENYLAKHEMAGTVFRTDLVIYKIIAKKNMLNTSEIESYLYKNYENSLTNNIHNYLASMSVLGSLSKNKEQFIIEAFQSEDGLFYEINTDSYCWEKLVLNHGVCTTSYIETLIFMLENYFHEYQQITKKELYYIINSFGSGFAKRFYKFHNKLFFKVVCTKTKKHLIELNFDKNYTSNFIKFFKVKCYGSDDKIPFWSTQSIVKSNVDPLYKNGYVTKDKYKEENYLLNYNHN